MITTRHKRIHTICIKAIEDIKLKTDMKLGKGRKMEKGISFVDASFLLGKKYFRKNFGRISDSDLKKLFKLKYGLD